MGSLKAQSDVNSIYSRFGIGDLNDQRMSAQTGLGGLSIGLRMPNTINMVNPASYTAIDTLSFLFDVGVMGKYTRYEASAMNTDHYHANFDHLNILFPVIQKRWASSFGLMPYSRTGYDVSTLGVPQPVIGVVDVYHKGSGNISELYWGHAFQYKWLSLGMNASFLFGNLDKINTVQYPIDDQAINTISTRSLTVRGFKVNFGLQAEKIFQGQHQVILGLTYAPAMKVGAYTSHLVEVGYSGAELADTLTYTESDRLHLKVPESMGVGLSYGYRKQWLVGVDYSTQRWQSGNVLTSDTLRNAHKFSAGIQFIPRNQETTAISTYFQRMHYRIGFSYATSYLQIQGHQPYESVFTAGLGLPSGSDRTLFNISYQYGTRGTNNGNLVKENFHILSFGVTLHDYWFIRRRFR